ncbi:DUF4153 domain-containing protein [Aerococcus sp.]|uniref:DUF4153 domain-containing protein n=1 Tax=Aerococcus sp. TaxID=1872398 RepID=UPI0028AD0255|nr:DUF4153 domain-containing protein [Aerococcus sp.]
MMRRFQSLDEWKDSLLRFPMVVLFGFIAAALSMYMNRLPYDQPSMMAEVGIYASTVGMLLATVVQVAYERFVKDGSRVQQLGIQGVTGFGAVVYYLFASRTEDFYSSHLFTRTNIAMFLLSLLIIWLPSIKNEGLDFAQSFRIWFKSFFVSAVYTGILMIGISLVLAGWSILISNIEGELYWDIFSILIYIFFPWSILSQQSVFTRPFIEEEGKMTSDVSKFLDILLTKIFIPIVTVYTVIIFIYFFSTLGNWTDITIEIVMVSYLVVGWMVLFLVAAIKRPFVVRFTQIYAVAVLIASVFQIYRSVIYSDVYGVTMSRYMLMLFCSISAVGAVLYLMKNEWLPLVLAAGLFVAMMPPVDAISVSVASQGKIVNDIIADYPDLVTDGQLKLTPENVKQLDETTAQKMKQSLRYLDKYNELGRVSSVPEDFDVYQDLRAFDGVHTDDEYDDDYSDSYYFSAHLNFDEGSSTAFTSSGGGELVLLNAYDSPVTFTALDKNFSHEMVDVTSLQVTDKDSGDVLTFDLSSLETLTEAENISLTIDQATFSQESDSYTATLVVQDFSIYSSSGDNSDRTGSGYFILILSEK